MTTAQRRELFLKTYENVPIFLLQGSVGERIKRNYTHKPPEMPLRLAGLYYSELGRRGLEDSFRDYIHIARDYDLPLIIHPYTYTLRPEQRKGLFCGDRDVTADNLNHCRALVEECPEVRDQVFIGTTMSFTGDAYKPETGLEEETAYRFHRVHAQSLEHSLIDHVRTGLTPALPEAAGCARALSETTIPYFVSFLVRKDGKLMDGTWLHDAIGYIDDKTADNPPLFYQVNCVHPRNLRLCLDRPENRTERVRTRFKGLEGNGSDLSPEELDNSPIIRTSPPEEWAREMMAMHEDYGLKVLGGCCGTDHDHLNELAARIRALYDKYKL